VIVLACWRDRHRFLFGHPKGAPPATYAMLLACEVPTSKGAATNGKKDFSLSFKQALSLGERLGTQAERRDRYLYFRTRPGGVFPFSFAARLACEAPTSRAVANRQTDFSLASCTVPRRKARAPGREAGLAPIMFFLEFYFRRGVLMAVQF